jgi:hypothetical protein
MVNPRAIFGTFAGLALTLTLLSVPAAVAAPVVNQCVQPNQVCVCASVDGLDCGGNVCLSGAGLTPDGQVGAYCSQDRCLRPGLACTCFAGIDHANCTDAVTGGNCIASAGPTPGLQVGALCTACEGLAGDGSACLDGTNGDIVFDNGPVHVEAHLHVGGL